MGSRVVIFDLLYILIFEKKNGIFFERGIVRKTKGERLHFS